MALASQENDILLGFVFIDNEFNRLAVPTTYSHPSPLGIKHRVLNTVVDYAEVSQDVDFYDDEISPTTVNMFRRF